ncbi:MAG TPA: SRPBCC domain-containing protein [Puia sp.]|nr:SRPBCC domain-containing protein [Puia sp.]
MDTSNRELVFNRLLNAPRELVFEAWTNPSHLAKWYSEHPASHQMTITFGEMGEKTDLTMRLLFDTAEEMERLARKYGAVEGGHQTLSRLQEWVEGAVRLA